MRRSLRLVPLAVGLTSAALYAAPQAQDARTDTVYYDVVGEDGRLYGGVAEILIPQDDFGETLLAPWVTLTPTGFGAPDPANRVDVVYVGDGYTAGEIGNYAAQVDAIQPTFFAKEPFTTYQNYFTVHRIDVVSNESGVDNDPVQGILRDTALDMEYWCNGTERLLCVSVAKASSFASNAPDADLICALANSTKYGGAGYSSSDLATAAAGNGAAIEIVLHEFGHALGDLADEYTYGGPSNYTGPEPLDANVSVFDAAQQSAMMWKWFRWLGVNDSAYDGLISTFEGARYSVTGIYRPTANSLMRNLGRPFNLPSIESLVLTIYGEVDVIDDAPPTDVPYTENDTIALTLMQPVGHSLDVQWFLDGVAIAGANGPSLDLSTLGLTACNEHVSVEIVDNTIFVRDEAQRAALMSASREYDLSIDGGPTVNFCTSTPNSTGSAAVMSSFGTTSIEANQFVLIANSLPVGGIGIFILGDNATQTPFGNGFLCIDAPIVRLGASFADTNGNALRLFNHDIVPPAAHVDPYDTKRFQYWFRNIAGGGAHFNLTNGLKATFCP